MEYFRLMQDRRISNSILMNGFINFNNYHEAQKGNVLSLDENIIIPIFPTGKDIFPAILDRQLYMVNPCVLKTFQLFEPKIEFKTIYLVNKKEDNLEKYYAPQFTTLDCLSDKSSINMDKSKVEEVVLIKDKIPSPPFSLDVFRVIGTKDNVIVISLELVECLLRRNINHYNLQRIHFD